MCVYVYMSILYIVCLFDVVIKLPFSKTKKNMSTSGHLPSNKCNHRSRRLAAKAKGGRYPRTLKERFSSFTEGGNLGSLSGHFFGSKNLSLFGL